MSRLPRLEAIPLKCREIQLLINSCSGEVSTVRLPEYFFSGEFSTIRKRHVIQSKMYCTYILFALENWLR